MASILLLSNLDVGRAIGPNPEAATPERVERFLLDNFRRGGGLFNYNPSIACLPRLFQGSMDTASAIAYCRENGAPAGRRENCGAIEVVADYAVAKRSDCYRTPFLAVPVGRLSDGQIVYMSIKTPLTRRGADGTFVVVPGFRKTHRPVGLEIDVASSLALATFSRDGLYTADFEYLYAGPAPHSNSRHFQVFHGRDRRIFSLDELDALLDTYVRGVQLALSHGITVKRPNFRGYRVVDPNQETFAW